MSQLRLKLFPSLTTLSPLIVGGRKTRKVRVAMIYVLGFTKYMKTNKKIREQRLPPRNTSAFNVFPPLLHIRLLGIEGLNTVSVLDINRIPDTVVRGLISTDDVHVESLATPLPKLHWKHTVPGGGNTA